MIKIILDGKDEVLASLTKRDVEDLVDRLVAAKAEQPDPLEGIVDDDPEWKVRGIVHQRVVDAIRREVPAAGYSLYPLTEWEIRCQFGHLIARDA